MKRLLSRYFSSVGIQPRVWKDLRGEMDYTLITTVAARHHLCILADWLDFLALPPQAVNVLLADTQGLEDAVAGFLADRDIAFQRADGVFDRAAREDETATLQMQMRTVKSRWALVIRLDTFPYRNGGDRWLPEAAAAIKAQGLPFMTGACRPFRADRPTEDPAVALTQRLSNNMLLMDPRDWLDVMNKALAEGPPQTRFFSEAALERYCVRQGIWGRRQLNGPHWRVFHTQVWDLAGQARVRQSFRDGDRIGPFLKGYEDDQRHPWTRYYLSPPPPLAKRIRIGLGAWRRRVWPGSSPPRPRGRTSGGPSGLH